MKSLRPLALGFDLAFANCSTSQGPYRPPKCSAFGALWYRMCWGGIQWVSMVTWLALLGKAEKLCGRILMATVERGCTLYSIY